MGFLQNWGLAAAKKPKLEAKFDLNERRNTTNLKKAAANLSYRERQNFLQTIKETGLLNKTVSNRQLLKTIDSAYGHKFRDKVKNKMLTHYHEPTMSEEERQRHIADTVYERLKEQREKGASQVSVFDSATKVKPAPPKQDAAKGEVQPLVRRPL